MNKQALAFISMFTLVLMLSIYYVSLGTDTSNLTPVNDVVHVMALMNEKNNEEKEEEKLQLKNALSDPDASEDKKKEVLLKLEQLEDAKKLEENLSSVLTEQSIKNVIQVKDNIIQVNVFEQQKNYENASKIMNIIYEKIKPNQAIELVFS